MGKTRLKGAKIVSSVKPGSPKRPRGGFTKISECGDLLIEWIPPIKDFDYYVLSVMSIPGPLMNSTDQEKMRKYAPT